jgi:hypothetical protein
MTEKLPAGALQIKIGKTHAPSGAETYLRELIAFYEIGKKISNEEVNIIDDWMKANAHLMSEEDRNELPSLLREFADAFTEIISSWEEGKSVTFNPPRAEPGAMFGSLIMHAALTGLVNHGELVNRAFLIASVSSFEVLFGHLVRMVYRRNPVALSKSEHAFTLEELSQYASIQDAQEALIALKVEALLMESVDGWAKWLDRTVNIELTKIVDEWPRVREIFSRRNIIVHADGKVNDRYLRDLRAVSIDTTNLSVGQKLDLPFSYLQDSLERLLAFGILLSYAVWSRLYKSELDTAVEWALSCQENLINHRLWVGTQLISRYLESVQCRREFQLKVQINSWLARKNMNGSESIQEEMRQWDTSGLSAQYQMVKSLFLGDYRKAKNYVIKELQDGHLTRFELATNPLFSDLYSEYSLNDFAIGDSS